MWRIDVDLSAASLRRMLCSLETHLECEDCKTQLTKHVDDIVVKWSLLDVSYLRTYRVRRSQIFDLRLFPAQYIGGSAPACKSCCTDDKLRSAADGCDII